MIFKRLICKTSAAGGRRNSLFIYLDYIKSFETFGARKVVSLFRARDFFSHQNLYNTLASSKFVHALNIAATYGLFFLLYILRFMIKYKQLPKMLLVLIWHLGFTPFSHNVVTLWLFYKYFQGNYPNEPSSVVVGASFFKNCYFLILTYYRYFVYIRTI